MQPSAIGCGTRSEKIFLAPRFAAETTITLCDAPTPCLLLSNIPTFLTLADLLNELAPFVASIVSMRLVLSTLPDTYGALITLRTPGDAEQLRGAVNLRPVSALAKEALFAAFVRDAVGADAGGSSSSCSGGAASARRGTSPVQRAQPLPGPQCAICLEPLGEEPQLTTVCGHTFHIGCIVRVEEEHCPLCRYSVVSDPATRASCELCGVHGDLWMCLVCGAVFCGRATAGHGQAHYAASGHRYALQVGGFRVWDHAGEAFVHRLISADDDAAPPVDAATKGAWWFGDEESEELERAVFASKAEAVACFYSALLQDQLAAQEQHYLTLLGGPSSAAHSCLEKREAEVRRRLATTAAAGYRRIVAQVRVDTLRRSQLPRQQARTGEVAAAEAVAATRSLTDAAAKVQRVMDDNGVKHAAKVATMRRQLAALEEELTRLLECAP